MEGSDMTLNEMKRTWKWNDMNIHSNEIETNINREWKRHEQEHGHNNEDGTDISKWIDSWNEMNIKLAHE